MNVIGLLRTLEQITRSPRLGHDLDLEDGAAQLTEREAETECLVPEDFNAVCRCVACVEEERAAEDELAGEDTDLPMPDHADDCMCGRCDVETEYCEAHDIDDDCWSHDLKADYDGDGPNPTEPGLTSDELVGVRELLERGGLAPDQTSASDHAGTGAEPALGEEPEESLTASLAHPPGYYTLMTDTFASNLYRFPDRPTAGDEHTASDGGKWIYELLGTKGVWDATNYPSPTIVQSAPPPTVDGGIGGGGVLHSPGARLPHPDDAAAEWIGEAVPVIGEVLGAHRPFQRRPIMSEDDGCVYCSDEGGHIHSRYRDYQAWLEHVAPLVANNIAPHDK